MKSFKTVFLGCKVNTNMFYTLLHEESSFSFFWWATKYIIYIIWRYGLGLSTRFSLALRRVHQTFKELSRDVLSSLKSAWTSCTNLKSYYFEPELLSSPILLAFLVVFWFCHCEWKFYLWIWDTKKFDE